MPLSRKIATHRCEIAIIHLDKTKKKRKGTSCVSRFQCISLSCSKSWGLTHRCDSPRVSQNTTIPTVEFVVNFQESSQSPLTSAGKGACLVHIFIPIFSPDTSGSPACSVLPSPFPSSSKFTQNTALPSTGRNVTPSSYSASQSTKPARHHQLSCPSEARSAGASSSGKFVPPPVTLSALTYAKNELWRFPPKVAAVWKEDVNQSV